MNSLSRRRLLKNVGALGAAGMLFDPQPGSQAAVDEERANETNRQQQHEQQQTCRQHRFGPEEAPESPQPDTVRGDGHRSA